MELSLEMGTVDLDRAVLQTDGQERRLRPLEVKLLRYLADRPDQVLSADELLREVWGYADGVETRTLYATMNRLRATLERDPKNPVHLLTVPRLGYRFRPPAQAPESRPRIPPRLPRPIGREALLASIGPALAAARLVTLRGPAGVGKSRLARTLLHEALDAGRPAFWCALAQVADEDALYRALASALGLEPGAGRARAAVEDALPGLAGALVVLDDADLARDALVEPLARWVGQAGPALVATCRSPLHTPGELGIAVPPLDAPAAGERDAGASGALLEALVRERVPTWELPNGAVWVAPLLRALGGIPLVLELAAPWLTVLSGPEVLERIEADVAGLRRPSGTQGRHGSVWDSLAWSWPLLAPWERDLLVQCTVFRTWFDLGAAADVVVLGPDAPPLHEAFLDLVERSWLKVEPRGVRQCFALYPGQRGFLESLSDPGTLEGARERHVAWLVRMGRAEHVGTQVLMGGSGWERVRGLLPDVRAALDRAAPADRVPLAKLGAGLLMAVGPHDRCVALADLGLAVATDPADRAALLHDRGVALRYLGRIDEARAAHQAILDLGDAVPALLRSRALRGLGVIESYHGAPDRGAALLERALSLSGDAPVDEAVTLAELATLAYLAGDLQRATALLERSLASLRELGSPWVYGVYVGNLGAVELVADDLDSAERHLGEALALHRRNGAARFESLALGNLALVAERRGHWAEAARHLDAAMALSRSTGDRGQEGNLWSTRGLVLLGEGRTADAGAALDRAAGIALQCTLPRLHAEVAVRRARVHIALGEHGRASELLDEAEGLAESLHLATERMESGLARVELALARGGPARALLEAVVERAGGQRVPDLERWWRRVGEPDGD